MGDAWGADGGRRFFMVANGIAIIAKTKVFVLFPLLLQLYSTQVALVLVMLVAIDLIRKDF